MRVHRADCYHTSTVSNREPPKRQQSLRDFIAESRRNQRTRQQNDGLGGDIDGDISVLVASAPRGRGGRLSDHDAPQAAAAAVVGEELVAEADLPEPAAVAFDGDNDDDGDGAVVPVRARRNIALELDEEDKAWATGGYGGGGEGGNVGQGGPRREERGRGHAENMIGVFELGHGDGEVNEEKEHGEGLGGNGNGSSNTLSRSSSPSSQQVDLHENAAGGQAVGAMEGVPPGLATYDSQRSAAGMNGARAGQEEYARMLELMQQVCELASPLALLSLHCCRGGNDFVHWQNVFHDIHLTINCIDAAPRIYHR